MDIREAAAAARRIKENIEYVIFGKDTEIKYIVSALFAGGHVLLDNTAGTESYRMESAS